MNRFLCAWLALAFILAACARNGPDVMKPAGAPPGTVRAVYISDTGEGLEAVFYAADQTVQVRLPDGNQVRLPVALSGSGARYSNGKETFWEHQGKGAYWRGDSLIFKGKIQPD